MRPLYVAAALYASLALAAIPVLAQSPSGDAGAGIPVVVAVDTSRSLNGNQLSEVVDRLRLALENLDSATPTGLLSFDDQPRWIVEPGASPGDVQRALQQLQPSGQFTLLNDALFVASRALGNGGVILLATDGRDENSATTVEDIARRCEAQGIRILSVGSGRAIEERSLRRLALLSGGDYLGPVVTTDASQIAESVQRSKAELAQTKGSMNPSGAATAPATGLRGASPADTVTGAPTTDTGDPPATGGDSSPQLDDRRWYSSPLWAALAILALALLAFLLGRRVSGSRRDGEPEKDVFEIPDLVQADEPPVPRVDSDTEARLLEVPVASMADAPEVTVDTAVFYGSSLEDRLEQTRVLTDRGVLISRRADDSPRLYLLGFDKAFSVGRSRDDNTLAIPDPALSAHHFRVVPDGQDYYLLDLRSTNGSFLNGHAAHCQKLSSGDVIRAGQVEFEFQSQSSALGSQAVQG